MSNSDNNCYISLEKGQDHHEHNEIEKVSREESS